MKSNIMNYLKDNIIKTTLVFISVMVSFPCITTIAQDNFPANTPKEMRYEVRGKYSRPIKRDTLTKATSLSDIIPHYPKNWISEYVSVDIQGTCDGKLVSATGPDDNLTASQKTILKKIDLGSDLIIDVKYKYLNQLDNLIENNKMHVTFTVVPEVEAEYIGGYQQMITYLKEKSANIIPEKSVSKSQIKIGFTINEQGDVTNAKITETTEDPKTCELLIEIINKMPKWKPAENSKGLKVKQDFVFSVGNGNC